MRAFGRRSAAAGLPPVLAFDLRAISVAEGVRAGLAIAAVVALGQWLHLPGLMEAALAAQLTCLCDAGGPVHRRVPALLVFGLAGAAITAGFGMLRGVPVAALPLAGATVFVCAFVRVFGPSAMQVGNLLAVVLALALRAAGPTPDAAPLYGLMFLGGALWALLLTAVIWRLQPYRPARVAVAGGLRALAAMAADMRTVMATGDEARWDLHARIHRHAAREALEAARAAVLAAVRTRGPAEGPAAQSWLRLEATDQLFGTLIALADFLAARPSEPVMAAADRLLRLLPPILQMLGRAVVADAVTMRPGLDRAIGAIPAVARDVPELRPLAAAMAERLRAALSPTEGADRLPILPRRSLRDVVAANLTWRSDALRHAARAAALGSFAFAVMLVWPRPYLHWFAMTVVLTLQPYFALTAVRAAERVGGTVLGGFLAAAIGLVATTPLSIAAAMFPLSVVAMTVRGVSFGLFMVALTPEVVLLSEIGQPGTGEWRIALLRALFTAIGGAVALLGSVALWPIWEPERLRAQMRAALAAHGAYAAAVISCRLGEATDATVDGARRAAGAASNAFEATLQRVLLERGLARRSVVALEALLTVDAALRRLAGRLSALALDRGDGTASVAWRAMRGWIIEATDRLEAGRAELPPRPAGIEQAGIEQGGVDGPFARLARPLELAAGALARLPPP